MTNETAIYTAMKWWRI